MEGLIADRLQNRRSSIGRKPLITVVVDDKAAIFSMMQRMGVIPFIVFQLEFQRKGWGFHANNSYGVTR
jgi:hypothetical protein